MYVVNSSNIAPSVITRQNSEKAIMAGVSAGINAQRGALRGKRRARAQWHRNA